MRALRLIACAALALSASACTILYLATNPYGNDTADAGADADVLGDAPADGPEEAASFVPIAQDVNALAVFDDTLYANKAGAVYFYDEDAGFTPLVLHDASMNEFTGLAVNDGGVFWTADDGIWFASLDGSVPKSAPTITDSNNPWFLALDGQRLTWTTHNGGTNVIHTCKFARSGCSFSGPTGSNTAGEGGPGTVVGADASVVQDTLAAANGYVAWVSQASANDQQLVFTNLNTNTSTIVTGSGDQTFGNQSDETFVTNDGTQFFWSFHNDGKAAYIIRTASAPDASAFVYSLPNGIQQSLCLTASSNAVGFAPTTTKSVDVIAEDGGPITKYTLGVAGRPHLMAVTSRSVFVVDTGYVLYRIAR